MEIQDHPNIPRYIKLAENLRRQMADKVLNPGDRLPSFAEMKQRHGVSQDTLERANALLEREGLIVRMQGRGVFVAEPPRANRVGATKRSLLSVIMNPDLRDNEYYMRILNGIAKEAHLREAEIMLCQVCSNNDWSQSDGIIVTFPSIALRQHLSANQPENVPYAATLHPGFYDMPCVMADEEAGIAASIEHLVALGHRRIGYLTIQKILTPTARAEHRLDAYRTALAAAGIEVDERWERPLRDSGHEPVMDFMELGRIKMKLWLEDNWAELECTALLAHNDETAIGMMQALNDAGIRVPEDVSLVGFDGISPGRCVRPQLSTVAVPLEDIGAAAVGAVLDRERNDAAGPRNTIRLPPTFVARDSTAAVSQCNIRKGI